MNDFLVFSAKYYPLHLFSHIHAVYTEHIVTVGCVRILIIYYFINAISWEISESSDLLVSFTKLSGRALLLVNKVHWFAKEVLKNSAFSLKFVKNLFSWNKGGMQEILLLFRKAFKIYVFMLKADID